MVDKPECVACTCSAFKLTRYGSTVLTGQGEEEEEEEEEEECLVKST